MIAKIKHPSHMTIVEINRTQKPVSMLDAPNALSAKNTWTNASEHTFKVNKLAHRGAAHSAQINAKARNRDPNPMRKRWSFS